ncbi:CHAT domain-containing protein [Pseudanabaena galeata UHCC 0370]|uniref:CHAT domain-containing protein n=1 Tax=Pseudanabaena galeata UHCC 0370 TaxID=3110310 RepID=A0ABU5TJ57_9CYAN|nr:CHAT domain-containing protein [Pseudanabaena galeata]MEA5478360.1 CHAT domain-containing protein [Pseudanabaena galeata UHCC 0370]
MASRFYALVFVALTGVLGMVSPPDLALMTVMAQTAEERKAEEDRILKSCRDNLTAQKFQEALLACQVAFEDFKKTDNLRGQGLALNNIGFTYNALDQYQKAIDNLQQSLKIAREIKDRLGEVPSLVNLGLAYDSLGKYDKSIEFHLQSLAIAREIKNRLGEGASLANLGIAYRSLGKYDKAIEFYLQSLAIAREIKNRLGEGLALGNLGIAYYSLGKYDKAIEFQLQSLAIAREIKNRLGEGTSLGNLGNAYFSLGKYDKAIKFQLQSLAIAREIKDRRSEGTALNNLAVAYGKLNRDREAMIYYQQALSIAREIGNRGSEGLTLANLGGVLSDAKRPELAILFYKQSINVREAIRKDISKLDQDLQKSYLATVEKTYRNLADLLLKQDRILEAQQVLDLLKVQELSDYLKTVRGNNQTSQGVDLQRPEQNIIALASELNQLQQKDREGNLNQTEAQRLAQLVRAERDQNKQFNSFLDSPEIKKLITELRRVEDNQNVDVAKYRKLQKDLLSQFPNAVLLYPLILEDRLELILLNTNTPPLRRTINIKREDLNEAIITLLIELRDKTLSPEVKENSQKLYNVLIKPFEAELAQLNIDTIIYAPDGQLRYIPLASLHDGKQWLVEKYRINNITAESLTAFNSKPITNPRIFAGAFGGKGGEIRAGFSGLPATINEVQKIASQFPNTTKLIEKEFTKSITEDRANSYTILHLATHGKLAVGTPEDSFILFGNGEKVTISELKDWNLSNIDLVVLSACQTALGSKLGTGIEVLGLGYQMQAAGARVAIASLWEVSDDGTQALMEAFYAELKKGNVTVTEALRRAQVTMIKSGKYNHPFYWSAFFAIGNGL